jgi:predicted sulfurtransferase
LPLVAGPLSIRASIVDLERHNRHPRVSVSRLAAKRRRLAHFERMDVYDNHVLRHREIATDTLEAQQWKSAVSDHGVVVVEFRNVL